MYLSISFFSFLVLINKRSDTCFTKHCSNLLDYMWLPYSGFFLWGTNFFEICKYKLTLQKFSNGREKFLSFRVNKALPRIFLSRRLSNCRNFRWRWVSQKFGLAIITCYTVLSCMPAGYSSVNYYCQSTWLSLNKSLS